MELKNFVDFAYSLINMDEVKEGVFQLPKEIKNEKGSDDYLNLEQEFDVEIFDITFRFKLENNG